MVINVSKCRNEHSQELVKLESYFQVTNYLSAAQLYLKDNFLLKRPLKSDDIKDRLLGHWGTCPGINLIYTHLNRLITENDLDLFLITGPGHGAPANLANLYLEGSLEKYYPELTLDEEGWEKFIKRFSWPGGFPSHLYPGVPGTIHEGGELGYALATAFGAIMDNPDLIVACIVGDGEAETGPTATAWHGYKFIDPAESGAVLPILHLNGYKISNPTIFGTMSDEELIDLFEGYGYRVKIVQDVDLHADMYTSLNWAYHEIKKIQHVARNKKPIEKPRFPLLILKSLKGWTGIKEIDGEPIEGSYRSHQIPASDLKSNPAHLKLVEKWLKSYEPEKLFERIKEITEICPQGDRRMGCNPHTNLRTDIILPPIDKYTVEIKEKQSSLIALSKYLKDVVKSNPKTFRVFCPDELESNKLGGILDVTDRDYQWPINKDDREHISSHGGRVLEILSEHTCQGWLQGYLLTGRHGFFPSYEAFLPIVATMINQYSKFLKFAREFTWRGLPPASLNYLETSTLWRQEHNGFSHQNPNLINILLNLKPNIVRIYLPPDANTLISTFDHCLQSRGYVNLVISNKPEMPQWLDKDAAIAHCRAGASIWEWASTDGGVNPDVVLVGIGDNPHLEVMAAAQILRDQVPELRVRVVNVTDLLILAKDTIHPHGLDNQMFEALFTVDRPVIINFHGYPSVIRELLFGRKINCYINGYIEEGTTTTPFDMTVRNHTSRLHVVMQAIRSAVPFNPSVAAVANEKVSFFEYLLASHREFIEKNGKDPDVVTNWKWKL